MKTTVIAALAALASLAAVPALSQTTPAATASASAALNVETTPIEVIAANEKAKAVIDKELPGLTAHEAYEQFKQMTLQQLMPMSQGVITDEKLKAVQAELDKVK